MWPILDNLKPRKCQHTACRPFETGDAGMVPPAFNLSTQEVEAYRSLSFEASWVYRMRPKRKSCVLLTPCFFYPQPHPKPGPPPSPGFYHRCFVPQFCVLGFTMRTNIDIVIFLPTHPYTPKLSLAKIFPSPGLVPSLLVPKTKSGGAPPRGGMTTPPGPSCTRRGAPLLLPLPPPIC